MLYTAQCNHDGLSAGVVYELDPEDVEYRAGAIEAGFLVRSEWNPNVLGMPEPEVLSTVGQPEPDE